jgi:hypothetical protein
MAAVAFTEGNSLITAVVADIKAAILTSADWSNPTGQRVLCTTTRGADMCVDLADAAATALNLQFGVYRTSALADKIVRYISWRGSGGATSNTVHWTVSAGKEHLYIDVEGPRPGETNAVDASRGSFKQAFFLGDVVPYITGDSVPTVVCVGQLNIGTNTLLEQIVHVGRNQANTRSWVQAKLASVCPPIAGNVDPSVQLSTLTRLASDGNTYMFPYVIFEEIAGLRGRIAKCFFNGFNFNSGYTGSYDPTVRLFSKVTFNSETYILLTAQKTVSSTTAVMPYGAVSNSLATDWCNAPLISIPCA